MNPNFRVPTSSGTASGSTPAPTGSRWTGRGTGGWRFTNAERITIDGKRVPRERILEAWT